VQLILQQQHRERKEDVSVSLFSWNAARFVFHTYTTLTANATTLELIKTPAAAKHGLKLHSIWILEMAVLLQNMCTRVQKDYT
jgi:hypothetical protein